MKDYTDIVAATHLGKKVTGSEQYDVSLLVAVPREENRTRYSINSNNLPFDGVDVWHAFEFSAMAQNGVPVTRLMKLKYSCDNNFIVESKSLKLYLNSFNMTKLGKNTSECLKLCKETIEHDLSAKLQTSVEISFMDNNSKRVEIFADFENIMDYVDEDLLTLSKYKESPQVLKVIQNAEEKEHRLMFDSLRSNCRVTHQPDFGDVFIYYKSCKHIDESSLVEYLVSFRSEFHFHEECCEMIYKRLYDLLDDGDELFVSALYTRRGGIDICPSRWSKNYNIGDIKHLIDLSNYARGGKQ